MKTYKNYMGKPDLVIALDAMAYTEKTLTLTSSLRGILAFDIKATVGKGNCHSGMSGGVIPGAY